MAHAIKETWCVTLVPMHTACVTPFTSAQVKVVDAELLTNWQRKNKEYKQRHQLNAHRESDTMARLTKFRETLRAAKPETKAKTEKKISPATEGVLCCSL